MFQDRDRQQFYDLWSDDKRDLDEDARQHTITTWKQYQVNHSRFGRSERGDIFSDERSWPEYPLSGLRASDREDLIRYIKSSDASPWAPQTSVCLAFPWFQFPAFGCSSLVAAGCSLRMYSYKAFHSSGNRVPVTFPPINLITWRINHLNEVYPRRTITKRSRN